MNRDFSGKRVVIMGLGLSGGGLGAAAFFAKHEASVLVTDMKSRDELSSSLADLSQYSIEYVLGEHRHEDFASADLVIRNPSVRFDSPYIQTAVQHGVEVDMSESLFMKLSPTKQIIGVTGTRGKSTTTAMIHHALRQAGIHTVLGGNVKGTCTLSLLDTVREDTWVVLELSSWQLQGFGANSISPHIAVVTNMYPDHLNYYDSMEDYAADKQQIFLHQKDNDHMILNSKNEYTKSFAANAPSHVHWFSETDWPSDVSLAVRGDHNKQNAAAAKAVLELVGVSSKQSVAHIATFAGVDGRLQTIAEKGGVTYVNDTTSTTPIAGIAALKAFASGSIILIAGGNTKNIPLDDFIDEIQKRVKYLVLFDGTASDAFASIQNKSDPIPLGDVHTAVAIAQAHAQPGDVILFSPGTTHLPEINEFQRGDLFETEVYSI